MPRVSHWLFLLGLLAASAITLQQSVDAQSQPGSTDTQDAPEESPLLTQPTTPEETFDAIVKLIDFARPDLARRYLEKLMVMNPDDAAILRIRDKHGPATFLRLSNLFSTRLFDGRDLQGWVFRATPDRDLSGQTPDEIVFGESQWKIGLPTLAGSDPPAINVAPNESDPASNALINIGGFDDPKATRPEGFDIYTAEKFGDSVFSCEFMLTHGNAVAVYMMGEYKILITDKYSKRRIGESDIAELHAAAAINVRSKKEPGEWQELQIRIQAPRFENGEKTKNARIVSMTLNGHVVRADREVEGPSAFGLTGNESAAGPVLLQGDHGPVAFRKIRVSSPQAVALLDRVNDAFKKASRAPERIEKLIDDLNGTPEEREVALIQLRSHALVALPHLLEKLGQPESEVEKDLVLYALTRLGRQIAAPLVASIETPDANLRATVIEALGYVGDHPVIPHLWYHAYSTDQPRGVRMAALSAIARLRGISPGRIERLSPFRVSAKLAEAARAHFSGRHTWTDSEQGQIEFWFWNREANTVESRQVSPQAASLYVGTEFARQALALAPERKDIQALYLAMSLGSAAAQAGSAAALPTGPGTVFDLALTTGAPTITEALRISQQNANTPAILATLRLLAQQGAKYRQLQQRSHRMPLLTALNYPDRQIQFAAASTILQIDPERSFSGSSRVVDILTRTLSDTGTPGGLVVDASAQRGTTVAATLNEQGYAATTAATGQAGFALAAKRNEIEIILLQYNTIKWGVTQTVANLRADARTAGIPIAIYGPDTSKHDVQHILDDYPAVTFILETTDSTDLRRQLAPFLAGVRTPAPTAKQRAQQKREAAAWFFYIASGRRTAVYNIRPAESVLFDAAHDPETADDALFALGAIFSSTCQGRLSDLVVNTTLPVETRELAALQLASQTQRNASTLSDEELHAIRKIWQSANSTELRTALASVVGALQPDAKLVGRRLEQLPRPQPPAPAAP